MIGDIYEKWSCHQYQGNIKHISRKRDLEILALSTLGPFSTSEYIALLQLVEEL